MSSIAFHDQNGETAYLHGSERSWMNALAGSVAWAVVPTELEHLRLTFQFGSDRPVFNDHDGTPLSSFSLELNTALVLGSDPVALAARLHGQCELHAYVEGPHREWLAGLMEAGRACGVYRPDQGWESVIELLRARADAPVVTSYSVGDSFPTTHVIQDDPPVWTPTEIDEWGEPNWDAWYDLPTAEQWALCMTALRARPEMLLELSPGNLRRRFGHARSLVDLFCVPAAVAP